MTTLLGIYLYSLAVMLIIWLFLEHRRGTVELLSIRNVAIAGFILFQLSSGGIVLITENPGRHYHIPDLAWIGFLFSAMATVFLVLALWAYQKGFGAVWLARRIPRIDRVPSESTLIAMTIVIMAFAVVLRFGVQLPVIGLVTFYVAWGLAAIACGLAGWIWAKRLFNPVVIVFVLAIFAAAVYVSMYGAFGRRGVVAVGAALIWGMYYSEWRYLSTPKVLARIAVVSLGPILLVGLVTGIRGAYAGGKDPHDQREALTTATLGDVRDGTINLLYGQNTAAGSMWVIDAHRTDFEHRHLMTVRYFFIFPILRVIWPDKPYVLGILIPEMAGITEVAAGYNVGPGIIGNAGAEGGWYALIIYAILGGVFLRFFDQVVRDNLHSPFVVVAMGAALGQVLGLARGETASFAFLTVMTVFGSYAILFTMAKMVVRGGWGEYENPPYDQWQGYGEDESETADAALPSAYEPRY